MREIIVAILITLLFMTFVPSDNINPFFVLGSVFLNGIFIARELLNKTEE